MAAAEALRAPLTREAPPAAPAPADAPTPDAASQPAADAGVAPTDATSAPVEALVPEAKVQHPGIDVHPIYEATAFKEIEQRLAEHELTIAHLYHRDAPFLELRHKEQRVQVTSLMEMYDEIRASGRQGLHIQRYKGLGEMNPDQLWETTMDPERRKMLRVSMEDAFEAERMFTLLMGDDVLPRREYIEKYASTVKDLDI